MIVSISLLCHLKPKVKQKCAYCTKSNERLNKEDQERFVCLKEKNAIKHTAIEPKANFFPVISFWCDHDLIKEHSGNSPTTQA